MAPLVAPGGTALLVRGVVVVLPQRGCLGSRRVALGPRWRLWLLDCALPDLGLLALQHGLDAWAFAFERLGIASSSALGCGWWFLPAAGELERVDGLAGHDVSGGVDRELQREVDVLVCGCSLWHPWWWQR